MVPTVAASQWDNGDGTDGVELLALDAGEWRVVPFTDPDVLTYAERLFPSSTAHPMYRSLEREIEAAQAQEILAHLPADMQATIEVA